MATRSSASKRKAPTDAPAPEGTGQRPIHQIRYGRIAGSVWERQDTEGRPWYSVTVNRLYKDEADQWQRSDSFSKNDLPVVQVVVQQLYLWLLENKPEVAE